MLKFEVKDLEEVLNMNLVNITNWLVFMCDRFKRGDIDEADMVVLMEKAKSHKSLFGESGELKYSVKVKLGKKRLDILKEYGIM